MSTSDDVIYLASCAVRDAVPDPARIAAMDLDAVYVFAARHMIRAAVAYALESAGCRDDRSAAVIAAAMRKTALFEQAWTAIRAELELAGIWYVPLKGAVIRKLYPKYGMREFADHDILIDAARAGDVKEIMTSLGFRAHVTGAGVHDCYYRAPSLNFEMHRALFSTGHDPKLYAYYRDVESRLLPGEGCERRFSPEDLYLYLLAHEYKHYEGGGTGLRSLLDTYVYLRAVPLDEAYVAAEAEKLGLRSFEEQNRTLAFRLFSGEPLTDPEREMLEVFLTSGTYGTLDRLVSNKMRKRGWGKLRYMWERFRVPFSPKNRRYAEYAAAYPTFYRHRILLPLLPFVRLFRSVRSGRFRHELRAVKDA